MVSHKPVEDFRNICPFKGHPADMLPSAHIGFFLSCQANFQETFHQCCCAVQKDAAVYIMIVACGGMYFIPGEHAKIEFVPFLSF